MCPTESDWGRLGLTVSHRARLGPKSDRVPFEAGRTHLSPSGRIRAERCRSGLRVGCNGSTGRRRAARVGRACGSAAVTSVPATRITPVTVVTLVTVVSATSSRRVMEVKTTITSGSPSYLRKHSPNRARHLSTDCVPCRHSHPDLARHRRRIRPARCRPHRPAGRRLRRCGFRVRQGIQEVVRYRDIRIAPHLR